MPVTDSVKKGVLWLRAVKSIVEPYSFGLEMTANFCLNYQKLCSSAKF